MKRLPAALAAGLFMLSACSEVDNPRVNPTESPPDLKTELSVKDYGAQGDGDTDDRPAIQAALDAASSRGLGVHFPAGTYNLASATLTGDRILRTYPNQNLRGDGHKVSVIRIGSSFGDYTTVIGATTDSTATGNWSMRQLRIDQNAQNGNGLDVTKMAVRPRMAVRLGSYEVGSSVTISQSAFVNSHSVNTLYLFGTTLRIRGNSFLAIGGIVGTANHDHSTVYTTTTTPAGSQDISANVFEGVRGSGGARTAIETHGGEQTVKGNTVTDYVRGANLTGIAEVATGKITTVGNTISRALVGVQVWASYYGSLKRGTVLSNVMVKDNTITLDPDVWKELGVAAPTTGVLINTGNTAPIEGISISGNTIRYLTSTTRTPATDDNSAAIYCRVDDPGAELRDLRIVDNRILSPLSTSVSPTCEGNGAQVARNTVVP